MDLRSLASINACICASMGVSPVILLSISFHLAECCLFQWSYLGWVVFLSARQGHMSILPSCEVLFFILGLPDKSRYKFILYTTIQTVGQSPPLGEFRMGIAIPVLCSFWWILPLSRDLRRIYGFISLYLLLSLYLWAVVDDYYFYNDFGASYT